MAELKKNKDMKFMFDEFEESVAVEITDYNGKSPVTSIERMDYFAFYELLKEVNEHEEFLASERERLAKEAFEKELKSTGSQQSKVMDYLYNILNLRKPLQNVIAVTDMIDSQEKEADLIIHIEITSASDYTFKKVYFPEKEDFKIGAGKHPYYKKTKYDYGSKYVVSLPVKLNGTIVFDDFTVKEYRAKISGGEDAFEVPFLKRMYARKLRGKKLEYLTNFNNFFRIFNTLDSSDFSNEEFKERMEIIKNKPISMVWEGLD